MRARGDAIFPYPVSRTLELFSILCLLGYVLGGASSRRWRGGNTAPTRTVILRIFASTTSQARDAALANTWLQDIRSEIIYRARR